MKRKLFEGWVVFVNGDKFSSFGTKKPSDWLGKEPGVRVVRIVEHSPAVDAVVREALKHAHGCGFGTMEFHKAVARLEKERAEK